MGQHANCRICTPQQLQKFYYQQKYDIARRSWIDINKVILKSDGVTQSQREKLKDIKNAVKSFNSGISTWDIEGRKDIEYSACHHNLEKLQAMGFHYFSVIPDFGIPIKRNVNKEFDNNRIIIYLPNVKSNPTWQPLKNLFTNGNLNKEKVKIFDEKNNEIDINEPYNRRKYGEIKLIITP